MTFKPGILFIVNLDTPAYCEITKKEIKTESLTIVRRNSIGVVLFCCQKLHYICIFVDNKIVFMRYEMLVTKCKKI